MHRSLLALFAFMWMGFFARGQQLPAPRNLRTDLLLRTEAVTQRGLSTETNLAYALAHRDTYQFPEVVSQKPVFTWEVDTVFAAISAYRVLVASSVKLLNSNKADFWDSGKVSSRKGWVRYNGKPLVREKTYFWKVQIWDERKRQTSFSSPASFNFAAPDSGEPFSHHPLVAQMEQARLIHKTGNGAYFLDFGKDALAQLKLDLTSDKPDTIWVEVGELTSKAFSIHKNPGRNIRYLKMPLALKKGTHTYDIVWPENEKRNSRNPIQMPAYIGEVYPFRYVTIHGYNGLLGANSVKRKAVFYPFDEVASQFVSSDTTLNQVWDLCKYSIKATSFTGYYVDGDSTLHTSLHANMFALAFGLVRPDHTEMVLKLIRSRKMACSVYGAQFLLDALYDSGQGQYALELMTSDWYNMIRSGSTISMEAWDKVYKPNLDLDHAWGAAPANVVVRHLMGIQPLTPGFDHFQIRPQTGSLRFAHLKTPTIKGPVSVRIDKSADRVRMEVIIPGGTSADVYVPETAGLSGLQMNGKAALAKRSDGFFVLKNMRPGKYTFVVH